MDRRWDALAARLVEGINAQPGDLVRIQDNSGRLDIAAATALALELNGATPFIQLAPVDYIQRLLTEAPPAYLAEWDMHRSTLTANANRMIHFTGDAIDFSALPQERFELWEKADGRLSQVESARPLLVACLPTPRRAAQLGMSLEQLEAILLPALETPLDALHDEIERVLQVADGAKHLTLRTGDGDINCELHLDRGERIWLTDDGYIDDQDIARGAIVSNLPAGSIYTTVLEDSAEGELYLPRMGAAREVRLRFTNGRIAEIYAASGAEDLNAMFDRHSGESRRISHLGIGLNPALTQRIGSIVVDEHLHGMIFIAFGDNIYMGGQNDSSLNVDYLLPNATLIANGRSIVQDGHVTV